MNTKTIVSLSLAVFMIGGAQLYGQSMAKPAAKQQRQTTLGQIVQDSSAVPMGKINHTSWNQLLGKYVDEAGDVNYKDWQASQQDSQALNAYIDQLSSASVTKAAAREDQMAFWINAYNAVTVKGILQEYPTTSIRNHTSETGGYNIWKNLLLNVGGRQVSLEAIEHQVLRPMGDARVHFALVCASKGCPRLLNEAYVGKTLNEQMDRNARHFFSIAQNFQHDQRNRGFKLSTIMKWYGGDFGADQGTQLRSISKFLPTKEAQAAANSNAVSISYLDYSWKLNEQAPKMKKVMKAGSGSKQVGGSMKKQGSGMKKAGGSGNR